MFAHIFKYRLKCLLHDKETTFWTMVFPLLLAVFFNLALSNVNNEEVFTPINVAVVDDVNYQSDQSFKTALNEASQGNDQLFNLNVTPKNKAKQLLNNNSIAGYIVVENPIRLVVNKSGFNQNIIKSFVDNYQQTVSAVDSILLADPTNQQELLSNLGDRQQYIREVSGTSAEPDNILSYFYTLIAMACFYGGFLGMRVVTDIQADLSPNAARVSVAPVHKMKTFLASISASLLIHLSEMLLLLIFLRFVLRVDFGTKVGYVLLTTIIGSIAGVFFGSFISGLVKKTEGVKVTVLICITMIGCFLAGLMYQNIKYIVAQNVPVLSYLNPVNLLTDAFYCLYYYDNLSRYTLNIGILCAFIVVFCIGTYITIRRRKYANL